ncbi:hypothetical protein DFH28DRAFT_1083479 [Melampsora americana]|nr:hypothetical protein DFH28DRAFT_1083479 [Melampsora americana]
MAQPSLAPLQSAQAPQTFAIEAGDPLVSFHFLATSSPNVTYLLPTMLCLRSFGYLFSPTAPLHCIAALSACFALSTPLNRVPIIRGAFLPFTCGICPSLPATPSNLENDPTGLHLKLDHQFVQRHNFIPWLRAQLEIDPIDETAPNPEPLVNYIKRRLALIQAQHQSKAANSSALPNSTQPPASAPSRPPHDAQSTAGDAFQPNSSAHRTESTSHPGVLINHGMSVNGNGIHSPTTNNAQAVQDLSSSHQASSHNFSPALTGQMGYSSQLGAIADAHMGSPSMVSASTHSLNSLAPNQIQTQSYLERVQQSASMHVQQPPRLNFSNEHTTSFQKHPDVLQQQQVPLQEMPQYQQQHSMRHQLSQQDQQLLLQHHQARLALSAQPSSTSTNLQSSPHAQLMQSNQFNGHPQQLSPQVKSLPTNGFVYFDNSPLGSDASNQPRFPDSMSHIHPNSLNGEIRPLASTMQHIQPGLDMSVPRIPPAVSSSVETLPQSSKLYSQDNNEQKASLVNQPRTTRSNTAAAKKNTQGANPSDATKLAPPPVALNLTNGAKSTSPVPVEPVVAPAPQKANDQYDRKAWKSRLSTLRAELDHIQKTPTRSANKLIKLLSVYSISPTPQSGDWSTVPPEGRLEVLSAIRPSANKDFYTAWAAESKGLGLLESWLKGSVHAHERAKMKVADDQDAEFQDRDAVLLSLLQMLEKMPITLDNLKNHTFAKQVLRINKELNAQRFSDNVKTLSKKLEQQWRTAVRDASTAKSTSNASALNKKRNEPSPEPATIKKRKVEPVTKPSTSSANKVPDGLFGRQGQKLPAFLKKKPEPAPSQATAAQSDPFAEAMAALREKHATIGLGEVNMTSSAPPKAKANGKPSKRVTFASDDKLCQIKIVERLVYEGEEFEHHPLGDARKMDAVEGRYLHHAEEFLEEEMEWVTPLEVILTAETIANLETSPLESPEAAKQEEREKTVVEVIYYDESQIPESPYEPPECDRGIEDGSGHVPKLMKLGGELLTDPEIPRLIARAHADNTAPDAPVAPDSAVSDILARLNGGIAPPAGPSQIPGQLTFTNGIDLALLTSLSQPGSLQALLAASTQVNTAPGVPPMTITQGANSYDNAPRQHNGWGAAAGSARMSGNRDMNIPTGPSAGSGKKKGRKHRSKDFSKQRCVSQINYVKKA